MYPVNNSLLYFPQVMISSSCILTQVYREWLSMDSRCAELILTKKKSTGIAITEGKSGNFIFNLSDSD